MVRFIQVCTYIPSDKCEPEYEYVVTKFRFTLCAEGHVPLSYKSQVEKYKNID